MPYYRVSAEISKAYLDDSEADKKVYKEFAKLAKSYGGLPMTTYNSFSGVDCPSSIFVPAEERDGGFTAYPRPSLNQEQFNKGNRGSQKIKGSFTRGADYVPRANSEAAKKFKACGVADAPAKLFKAIGFNAMSDIVGLKIRSPGLRVIEETVWLYFDGQVPPKLKALAVERIPDIEAEKVWKFDKSAKR